jgi:hypothetical protein
MTANLRIPEKQRLRAIIGQSLLKIGPKPAENVRISIKFEPANVPQP